MKKVIDSFDGNFTCAKCANIPGKNNLGRFLMEIREDYKNELDG